MDEVSDFVKGQLGPWFVKPDACEKVFSGRVFNTEELQEWVIPAEMEWDHVVLVNYQVEVGLEYRVWIVEEKAVAVSAYNHKPQFEKDYLADNAKTFAEHAAKVYAPAQAFVMDVCFDAESVEGDIHQYHADAWRIVELNAFNCAGLYDANVTDIVRALDASIYLFQ